MKTEELFVRTKKYLHEIFHCEKNPMDAHSQTCRRRCLWVAVTASAKVIKLNLNFRFFQSNFFIIVRLDEECGAILESFNAIFSDNIPNFSIPIYQPASSYIFHWISIINALRRNF